MKTEALKVVLKGNAERMAGSAKRDYINQEDIFYILICRMNVITAALAALNDDLLNDKDAKDTLVGCEFLSRDLLANLRDISGEVTG